MNNPGRSTIGLLMLLGALGGCASAQKPQMQRDLDAMQRETTAERLESRGEAFASVGDHTRAEQYLVAARKAGANEAIVTKRLLMICIRDSRFPAALQYAEEYLNRHPMDTEVRFAAATIRMATGDGNRARELLERVLRERPDLADAHYALAVALRQEGESPFESEAQFREYLRLKPEGAFAEAARSSLFRSVP